MAKSKTVSSLRSHTGFWLRMVSNHVSHSFAAKLQESGVTVAEWVILRQIYDIDASTSPGALAEQTMLTKGAVSKLVDRLLQKKLVTRSEANHDRRYQEVALTKKAVLLVPRLASLADENDEEFFSVLTISEKRQLMEILRKVARLKKLNSTPVE